MSLRKVINAKCKDCIYDNLAAGTWRQQVELCSVYSCPIWPVRPVSRGDIPQSVLTYYGITEWPERTHEQPQNASLGAGGAS